MSAAQLFAFAVLVLHLPPRAAWRLSLREVLLLARAMGPRLSAPPARADLAALMRRFPDQPAPAALSAPVDPPAAADLKERRP